MSTKVYKVVLMLATIVSLTISADPEIQTRYGVGVFVPNASNPAEVKLLSFALQDQFGSMFIHKGEIGFYGDSRADLGRRTSGYLGYSLGVRVGPQLTGLYLETLWGVAAISHTDVWLGGNLQFMGDLAIGFQDRQGKCIGVAYKHISSAGIFMPNKGRDFLVIQVCVPLGPRNPQGETNEPARDSD